MAGPTTVELEYGNRRFAFELFFRELDFGPAGRAMYYWMDSRRFRAKHPGPNFRACVDFWWTDVEMAGAAEETDNQVDLIFAECYPLVSTARSLQDIYIDAQLHKMADRQISPTNENDRRRVQAERTYSLPQDEVARLRRLAASRDVDCIRAELEGLFLGEIPPAHEMPAHKEAARAWIGNGLRAFHTGGRDGLRDYVGEVGQWIEKYRKQGNQDRVRRFINRFGYECKVAFYVCHTSAWVGLVQKLVADGRLNVTGERFMRLWHHQNQSNDNGDVPGGARDVFCRQVLSLHPLSAIVQTDSSHLATIGRWLAHPDYETLQRTQRVGTCSAYGDMVATILQAAHEYDHARRHWETTRGRATNTATSLIDHQERDDAPASISLLFQDYCTF